MRMALDRFTAFLIFQLFVALVVILLIVFRPGPWSTARWIGLSIALPAAVLLFVARWQLGRSFSVTPQARQLVTHGLYSKIRNPIYVFSGLIKEAKVLEAKFGETYREYKAKTWF